MTLNELGAMLLEARTRRNLSVQDMADRLKLPVSTIQAIEDGNLKELPHPAYARGFIKAYASMLGLSPDLVHEALVGLVEEDEPPVPLVSRRSRSSVYPSLYIDGGSVLRLIGLIVVLALLATLFWFREPLLTQATHLWQNVTGYLLNEQSGEPSGTETPMDRQDEASSVPEQTGPSTSGTDAPSTDTLQQDAWSTTSDTAEDTPAADDTAADQPVSATVQTEAGETPSAESGGNPPPAQAPAETSHKLVISAVDTCWVMVRPDTAKQKDFSLHKGEEATFTFSHTLTLRLGNAGGVRLTYDGKELPPPGNQGQVRTLTFPPAS